MCYDMSLQMGGYMLLDTLIENFTLIRFWQIT